MKALLLAFVTSGALSVGLLPTNASAQQLIWASIWEMVTAMDTIMVTATDNGIIGVTIITIAT